MQVSQRIERLRQRVEADSDTTAAALRGVSSAFDEALIAVQQRAAASEQAFAAEQREVRGCEGQLGWGSEGLGWAN